MGERRRTCKEDATAIERASKNNACARGRSRRKIEAHEGIDCVCMRSARAEQGFETSRRSV
jgi:hypothetical protein